MMSSHLQIVENAPHLSRSTGCNGFKCRHNGSIAGAKTGYFSDCDRDVTSDNAIRSQLFRLSHLFKQEKAQPAS
ncbi:hypothetical protein SKAU_G00226260 [Synaphobranchus kaupii]|uniref:Uncharacterized protein n=1 Tax=Synaphobranchus kaupii TaxID=118154 RepID=A0A9Q1F4Z0_SYNKA|nr:hypothetical protein SKAU_G00226260 [Synaphobranchus kaupii]